MTSTAEPTTTPTAAHALTEAAEVTAATNAKLQPARAALDAARDALAAAEDEALQAIVVKNPDAKAARERIEKSRAAIKTAEDGVRWAVLELHAVEAQHEQAHAAEQAARRCVVAEEYAAAHAAYNNENSRENVLLRQLESVVAELIPLICDRKDQHDRLSSEWSHLPPDERPQLKPGKRITATSIRLVHEHIAGLTPEIATAIKDGAAAADAELTERRRAQRHG